MKILVTGAHFTPAVATLEELKKYPGVRVVYAGRKTTQEGDSTSSIESQILPSMGIKFIPIITGRLQRTFTIYTIPSLLKIPVGFIQSFFVILSQKPDVILSFGGYVAVPLVMVGWLFSIPIIIHEQTLVSGLANKICGWFADKIAVSFPNTERGEKVILTGNPIRRIVRTTRVRKDTKLPTILITGGNQGSHIINLAVEQCIGKLTKIAQIIHVTGDNKFRDYERLENISNSNYSVRKWINKDWGDVLSQSDLVVSRAGINTLTEVAILGKPTLTIPIQNKEQNKNAEYFEKLGLTKILTQSKLSGQTLLENIKLMLNNLKSLNEKAGRVKKNIITDGASRLALETILLVNN
ncbi:MAG: UDP-N-acetylglucosamine--N-acetylmuramyl-(pentapeptide) pyrophosphoryl-undecaprenol N-acetylglucosamine transferase [Candidatus Daviesbacteria bacterium]|nr:UDP-N-acetylglucosamine--N-acetylmuramyl-(pentapeptide) pyrophosphoryl-undecaprenol N-acetylglucosamine transferase [Candidatus Daviesbacteria bacterium]